MMLQNCSSRAVALVVAASFVCALSGCGGSAPAPKPPTAPQVAPAAPPPTPGPANAAAAKPERSANAEAVAKRKVSGPNDEATKIEIAGLTMDKPVTWVWTQPSQAMRVL